MYIGIKFLAKEEISMFILYKDECTNPVIYKMIIYNFIVVKTFK